MFNFCNHFINNGSNNSAFYTRVAIKTIAGVSSLFFFSPEDPLNLLVFREREKGEGRRKRQRERVTSALFLVMFFSEKLYPV